MTGMCKQLMEWTHLTFGMKQTCAYEFAETADKRHDFDTGVYPVCICSPSGTD